MSDLSDAEVRKRVRDTADRHVYAVHDLIRRRTDRDVMWEIPGDLDKNGDGTGLIAIYRQQILGPERAELERAEAELQQIERAIEERKRRLIGPTYRPAGQTRDDTDT